MLLEHSRVAVSWKQGQARKLPCLLSTSISDVNGVAPTVHSSTGPARLPTWAKKKKYSNQNMQVHKISHNHIVKDLPGTPNTVGVCLRISCVYMPWLCICNHFAAQGEIKCTKFARQLWILGWSCLHNWTLVPIFYKVQCKYASFEYDGANSKFWTR